LNLGCGPTFHPDWVNIDIRPTDPRVRTGNITNGIPLEANVCDAVYHSHVLEHLSVQEAQFFLAECYRVLKPGGVLRVVVPDLEQIARLYLEYLESAVAGGDQRKYDWMVLELIDQVARSSRGGAMAPHLAAANGEHREFIRQRFGLHAENMWRALERPPPSFAQRVRDAGPAQLWFRLRVALAAIAVGLVGGTKARNALREGVFRQSRETHLHMYDRFSLSRLLRASGFRDPRVLRADESSIPDFARYELDLLAHRVRKPDSLFMEANKPPVAGSAGGETK
jgi:SAM-dependent methyltransferase